MSAWPAEQKRTEREKDFDPRDCKHEQTRLVYLIATNGVLMYHHQCVDCGEKTGEWIPKGIAAKIMHLASIPMHDVHLKRRMREKAKKLYQGESQTHSAERAEFWDARREQYRDYLNSPQWQRIKRLVHARANNLCEGCRASPSEQVHHLTYDHIKQEFLFELVALCRDCHERLHHSPKFANPLILGGGA